ncbi:MAG: Ig-like domain-containing protein [Pseudomonadota bacterium]|nr:Ig-like domain-containing protein [Pseudomonadota bacterium]
MLVLLALAACTPADTLPGVGFAIVGVSPDDGATDVVEAHIPELRFSEPIDPELCTPDALRVDGVHEDETVAFSVELEVISLDEGYRVQLTPADTLPTGWSYRISARAGADTGCQSVDGGVLEPFASSFAVP